MTTPTVESVATLAGRELDAAVHERVFDQPVRVEYGGSGWKTIDPSTPHYSTSPVAFFAMVEKVRENGWAYTMSERGGKCWAIIDRPVVSDAGENGLKCLTFEQHKGEAGPNQLPLAFARAALLTTITPKGG